MCDFGPNRLVQLFEPGRCANIGPHPEKVLAADAAVGNGGTQQRRERHFLAARNAVKKRWLINADTAKSQAWRAFWHD